MNWIMRRSGKVIHCDTLNWAKLNLNGVIKTNLEGDEAVEEQVQTWDSSVNLPHDWREQHAHDKCKMISDIVRAEVRDGSSTGGKFSYLLIMFASFLR